MAQYNRPPTVKPKKPDEFISFFDHVIQFFINHQNIFYITCAAVIVVFGSYGLYKFYSGRKIEKLSTEYYKAESSSGQASIPLWQNLEKKAPSPLQQVAQLQMAGEYLQEKNFKEAAMTFEEVGQEKSFLLSSLALLAQGEALENNRQYSDALTVYQNLSQKKNDPYQYHAKLGMARALLGLGKGTEAETILFELQEKGSNAPEMIKSAALQKLLVIKLKQAT